jgi:acyl phosphate:glycerol-3-phosphate acyltransferase
MIPALVVVVAYLIGAIPFGYLLVRFKSGKDIRTSGSGNIGATNVLRTSGRALGVTTLLLDIAKGLMALWIADRLTHGSTFWMSIAALAVMAGHAFPVFLRFHGGKAVASFIGAFLYLTPVPLLSTLLVFVIVVAATRYISMGSIIAVGCFPFAVFLIEHASAPVLISALVASIFIIYRHRGNIERIRAGNENVFTFGGRRS